MDGEAGKDMDGECVGYAAGQDVEWECMGMMWTTAIMILLHTPDGNAVMIAPDQITMMRARPEVQVGPKMYTAGAHCTVNLADGKFVAVRETCEEVKAMIGRSGK